jgi:hypothetical protein
VVGRDKYVVDGDLNITVVPPHPHSSQDNRKDVVVYPERVQFDRKGNFQKQQFFVQNRSDETHYSVEFELLVEEVDERCEEVKVEKMWKPEKSFGLDMQGVTTNWEFLPSYGLLNPERKRIVYCVLAQIDPHQSRPFVATFESNCDDYGILNQERLVIPLKVKDYDVLDPPAFSRNGNTLTARRTMGSAFVPPGLDDRLARARKRLEEKDVALLTRRAAAANQPLLIVVPVKDKDTGSYFAIKKTDESKKKYSLYFAYDIQNVGPQDAKKVAVTKSVMEFSSNSLFYIGNKQYSKPWPVRRTIGAGNFVTFHDGGRFDVEPRDLTQEELNLIAQSGAVCKLEVSYSGKVQAKGFKTIVGFKIAKDTYSVIDSKYE